MRINKLLYAGFLMVIGLGKSYAQENNKQLYTKNNKGKFYVNWGGNRAFYSTSNINFYGSDYNFTVHNATAHDKPKGWHIDYINPTKMTIPQTNVKVGYFISDKYSVSLGVDHMKYVMTQNQEAKVTGNYPNQGSYNEQLPNGNTLLTEDFLMFEHTDGLNYVTAEITRHHDFSHLLSIQNTDVVQFNALVGLGTGILYPKTNATVLGRERNDDFYVAGWGASAKGGMNITFLKHFFVQYEAKFGYINIAKTYTNAAKTDYAKHDFTFYQSIISVGGIFRL